MHIRRNFLIANGGLIAKIECCVFDAPVQIKEYSLIVIRDNSTIGYSKNMGSRYTSKSIELLTSLKLNDQLIVCRIVAKLPEDTLAHKALEFNIDEQ